LSKTDADFSHKFAFGLPGDWLQTAGIALERRQEIEMNNFAYELNAPKVAAELLDGEVMVINFDDGMYFSLRGSAAAIWALIASQHNVAQTVQLLAAELPNAAQTVADFVAQLDAKNLVRRIDTPHPTAVDLAEFSRPWGEPVLDQYDDMQMLLLLDPIHEVNPESGWPIKKQA
jgi:hypothetical protein